MPACRRRFPIGPFHFTSVGVRISGKPELTEWKGPLQFALWCQRAGPWWIGDLLNAGEDRFGESFSQMCEGAVSAEMLNRYASVARRVPIENRVASLSWTAHAMVARLPLDHAKATAAGSRYATVGRVTSCARKLARSGETESPSKLTAQRARSNSSAD